MSGSSLAGKVAVVTGAGGGLGAATARRLADAGAHVVAVDIHGARVDEVVGSLATPGLAVVADVSAEAEVEDYVARALERFGRIDMHHLNAGIPGTKTRLPEIPAEEFEGVMRVNVHGPFYGMKAAFRQFEAQQSTGAVVITASIASLRGSADLIAYHVSKHAVLGLCRSAAVYGGPLGVRVNAVAPGIVPTDLFSGGEGTSAHEDMIRRAATVPQRRAGTPDEVASVVTFLLSDEAGYITGEVISADGGASAVTSVRDSGGAGAWDTGPVDAYSRSSHR